MEKDKQDEITFQEKESSLEENRVIEKELPEQEYYKNRKKIKKKIAFAISLLLVIEAGTAAYFVSTIKKDNIHQRVVREFRYQMNDKLILNTGTYSGEMDFGVFDGKGEFLFDTGSVYEGDWENDFFDGVGQLKIPSEGTYEGAFLDGLKSGHGIFAWDDGDIYEGEWKKDHMDGQGVYTTKDGTVYTGIFDKNAFQEGKCEFSNETGTYLLSFKNCSISNAEIKYTDGTNYSGVCSESDITGTGTMVFANEDNYTGEFEGNQRSGKGIYTWKSGASYDGDWLNDEMNGTGTYTYSPNNYATGTFEKNIFIKGSYHLSNDFGEYTFTIETGEPTAVVMTLVNGTTYSGGMSEGKLNGNAQIQYSNGDTYSGNVTDNQKSGQGTYTWTSGASYEGKWSNDRMHGNGTYNYPKNQTGYQLTGEFNEGRPNGECTYYVSATEYYKTDWSNGKCVKVYE